MTAFQLRGLDSSLQLIAAFVKKGGPIEPVRTEMTSLVEDFYKTPPTAEEMERTRRRIANQAERTLDDQEEVLAVTRKYIDPARITIIKAGDFAKVAKAK